MMGHSERKCDVSDEAALKGICDVFRRLRDKGDLDASAQCDEVIATCCHQLAYVYGTKLVDVIQWLYNPQHELAPKSFAAFVKENSLSKAFRLHYSKQSLRFMREVKPLDTIIVNNAKKPTPPEDPEHSEVAESHELAVLESTCHSKTRQSGIISEEILTHRFHTLDEISIPEHDINSFPDSKSDSNGSTLLPTSDSDVQQTRSPSPQVLAQGCHTDHGPKLNYNAQGTEDGSPTTPDMNQIPKPAGLAKTLQSYEAFLALAPTSYRLSYKTNAISRQLPLIRGSKTGCQELLQRTPHNAQGYHGYSNDYHNQPIRIVLPDPRFDGRKPSDTRRLEDWAMVSRIGVRKCPRGPLRPPLIKLPPLKHSQNKTRMPGQLSLPVLWKRTPLTNASASQSTCASVTAIGRHCLTQPGTAGISTLKKRSSCAKSVPAEAKSSKGNSALNRLAEKSWPQPLPGDLVVKLAMIHTQCTKSWMASFGQNITSYWSGELYQCPFDDGGYPSSFLFLCHLVDEHSERRLLKTYDPDNQLILISQLKPQG